MLMYIARMHCISSISIDDLVNTFPFSHSEIQDAVDLWYAEGDFGFIKNKND